MPGFGSSPFGANPFGEWLWSDTALWRFVPELHRLADEAPEADGALHDFMDSIQPSFTALRTYIRDFSDLRLPQQARTQYDGEALYRLGKRVDLLGDTLQYGQDGAIQADRTFYSVTARFTSADRGRRLTIARASVAGNNGTYLIGAVIDTHTVILDPLCSVDAGPFRWEVRAPLSSDPDETVVEVQDGDVGPLTRGWVLTDGRGEYPVEGRQRLRRPTTDRVFLTEKEGTDGSIDPSGRFVSASAVFTPRNVGQVLSIDGDPTLENKGYARILRVVGTAAPQIVHLADITTGAPLALNYQPGPFHWALYPRALMTVQSTAAPIGVVEQEGYDLEVAVSAGATATVVSPSAAFEASDVGKVLRLVSLVNFVNNRLVTITAVTSTTTAQVMILSPEYPGVGSLALESGVFWELRATTRIGDSTQARANPSSMLQFLARDFGVEIDTQESEDIQRSWVANVTQWLDLKGTAQGYRVVGLISGFDIEALALYRISLDLAPTIPDLYEVELREAGPGRSGTDGGFQPVSGRVQFEAPSAVFTPADIGRLVRVEGAAVAGNNRLYTIDGFTSAEKVLLRPADEPVLPEANSGSLRWAVARLYTTLAPLLPRMDEVNGDALAYYLATNPPPGDYFAADTFCWEDGFTTSVPAVVTSVTNLIPSREWTVVFTGPGEVVASIGSWFLEIGGARYFLEADPVEGPPGTWTTTVRTVTAPPTGAARLRYQCKPFLFCDYCAASKVLATISVGAAIGLTPQALERYRERILLRLRDVTPAHVELITRFQNVIECVFGPSAAGLQASVEPGLVIAASIMAPLTAYYDDIPADVYGDPAFDGVSLFYTDLALIATIETP